MNIIPTKKVLPLFSSFTNSDIQISSDEHSFYSWHANYFTLNRKKILVLVNDLSFSSIVLADINAKNKKELITYIKMGIEEVFSYSDVPTVQIKKYFLKAGRIELSSNDNRALVTIANNIIQRIKCCSEDIDFSTILQPEIMKVLANVPFKSQSPNFSFSTEVVKRELNKLM
ncbi:DUF6933 domain-containing protein [Enterococcus sp. AZ196]|uniref:DUF6933 domain-containing protein n=1 Tax=Enterococcus sp. AZ196 TaxID=2774659 RepID=UPI003D2B56DE